MSSGTSALSQLHPQGGRTVILVLAVLLVVPRSALIAADVRLDGATVMHFAAVEESRRILSVRDPFVAAMSPFDRQGRVETGEEVSEDQYLRFATSHARPWSLAEIARVTKAIETLRPKLASYALPLPPVITLIHTTGREEGQAAYCRGSSIILPSTKLSSQNNGLERLLNHELFHILSRHNPKLRDSLYRIIGFRTCSAIEPPLSLRDRRLTNPDAPLWDSLITLNVDGRQVTATPILLAKAPRYDPQQGGSFFRYLDFRLLAVQPAGNSWEAVMSGGEPQLLAPGETPDYARQIGGNTHYILHPDEILADNFVHLIQQTQDLPTPHIVEQMRDLLKRP